MLSMTTFKRSALAALAALFSSGPVLSDAPNGAALYDSHCASCHEGGVAKAPHRTFLGMLSPELIDEALNQGSMVSQAADLDAAQRHAIIKHLTGKVPGEGEDHLAQAWCDSERRPAFDISQKPLARGWGVDARNSRAFPAAGIDLSPTDYPKLELAWSFGFPGSIQARSQPAVGWGRIFVGSADGRVYALDRKSGCIDWVFQASAEVRTAIVPRWDDQQPETEQLIFGDLLANLYVIDARDGSLVWRRKMDDHPSATMTGSPVWWEDRIYAPISSLEVTSAAEPQYGCCTFRGSVNAVNLHTGELIWTRHTVPEPPAPTAPNVHGVMQYGPSGSPVWNSPTLDPERGLVYFGTGENYSSPADHTSDAIFALEMKTGEIRWIRQVLEGDAWNMACVLEDRSNCPEEDGPDLDFASSVYLMSHEGRDWVIAAQKSGEVFALDPDDQGKIVWRKKVGRGGIQGGVHFGIAADGTRIYVPISDYDDPMIDMPKGRPGLYALDGLSGEELWAVPAEDLCGDLRGCSPGISAAITAAPGVVIAGSMDGVLRVHAAETGKLLWSYDAKRSFSTVNGVTARGGSFGGDGPVLAGRQLIVNSGYGIYGHMPGNTLLVFEAPVSREGDPSAP